MRKTVVLLFISVMALSCGREIAAEDLAKLNGYWEIQEAVMADGTQKEYTVNPTIDFFELKGKTGFRKKVMPQFDGTYRVNDLLENITIEQKEGKTFVNYTTEYAKWKEEIIGLSQEELVVKNQHDIEYHYKRPKPFSVK
ncbi:hypothetical protein R1T16_08465 [Flavobacterium sp. DG1-102-2]|uniref:hypothetical protein n=1 Tax=Flavobacterium sp. DG1-102-2 TaxID=3081663 RepID=UPI002949D868|nr:hypothetical protein [Flavobacterium sp. DG1-102-2]MDV6168459.1 hypothetical protein [Flavobacterium sp. DG1-102-2]